jgi:hypothetical protein
MPYQGGERLPGQGASKTSHISLIESPLMQNLVRSFERRDGLEDQRPAPWFHANIEGIEPLGQAVSSDGSLQKVTSSDGIREICFVKTARFHLRTGDAAEVDPRFPHPLQIQRLMKNSAVYCSAVFPLRNMVLGEFANVQQSIRALVREILTHEHGGLLYETLKWLLFQGWGPQTESPDFQCPHGDHLAGPLQYNKDERRCQTCSERVYLTDVLGLHHDIGEESASMAVANAYMGIHEVLLLVAHVYRHWRDGNLAAIDDTLLVKDGPLMFRGQYATLTECMRSMFAYLRGEGITVYLVGQEKSGQVFDHLEAQLRQLRSEPEPEWPQVAILSHQYMRDRVHRLPKATHIYGSRTNYGEKVLVRLDPTFAMVVNIPTGQFLSRGDKPSVPDDFIGFHRIIATLPRLVSYLHEGSLVPINLAHGVASLSDYPSNAALTGFSRIDDRASPPR